ncbi:MAG: AmmeMemoRadiSam system protein B, partial [Rhodospirillales bacterium]|nr:AmmeMemoRadiSam system protein B [Rhodospirillales bacterium]
GLAAPAAQAFDTPLGRLEVDLEALGRISDLPQVMVDDRPHLPEHALEVQLPFILAALGPVDFLPLVVGRCTAGQIAEVLERLWGGPETLIVVSSDLSHYLPYDLARQRDAATAAAIEHLEGARLGPEDACGYLPVAGLLAAVERSGLEIVRLDLRNSGDTAGPRDRVVGYGAWAFYGTGVSGRGRAVAKS